MTTTARPLRPEDAEPVLRMWHAHHLAVLGRTDATLDDARDALSDPDLEPGSPVVLDGDGAVLGCAMVFSDGGSGHADLDVVVDPRHAPDLFPRLLRQALDLAAAGARERGQAQVRADQACYREDARTAEQLRAAGFAPATSFHRMRRELHEPVEVRVPDGVVIERVAGESEEDLRRAHRLHLSTFAGHFGFEPRTWQEWLAAHRARSGTGPLWFAVVDGEDAGFLHETDQFVHDEDAGYVWRLGVQPAARGRGVAKALLLSSMADMRARGRKAALLHVDSANTTGATRLYEQVGMEPVVVIDVWRCIRGL